MWPDRVSNPEPLTYESGTLPTVLCGPADNRMNLKIMFLVLNKTYVVTLIRAVHSVTPHKNCFAEMVPIRGHDIFFNEKKGKIIPKSSLLLLCSQSTA